MDFEAFERFAREVFDDIPTQYREGIDALTVRREARSHPELPDVYTLGECLTEEHLSDFGSADTTRSVIALYWGSFEALSKRDTDFDWEEETWETLTHELRHHLESLAGDDALEGVDYAADESFRRFEGHDFDPWFYQFGDAVAEGLYRVEKSWYVEVPLSESDFASRNFIPFEWEGRLYRITRPDELGDVHFVHLDGLEIEDGFVELVLVRKRSWWESAKRLFGAAPAVVLDRKSVV